MSNYVKNKIYDYVFIIYAPIIALIITFCLSIVQGDNFVVLGLIISIIFHGMGDSTTVLRAYLNKEIFNRFKYRIILIPLILLGISYLSIEIFLLMFLIEIIWDFHHTALQTWGLGLIYDEKGSNKELFDKIYIYATHTIPFILFYSGLEHISTNFIFLERTPFEHILSLLRELFIGINNNYQFILFLYLFIVIYYIYNFLKTRSKFSNKHLLYLNTTITILFFILIPEQVFLIYLTVEIFHGMQSFGLSIATENKNIAKRFLRKNINWSNQALILSLLFCLMFGFFEWYVDISVENDFYQKVFNKTIDYNNYLTGFAGVLIRLRLIQNFMHYYCDSFIWSRKILK